MSVFAITRKFLSGLNHIEPHDYKVLESVVNLALHYKQLIRGLVFWSLKFLIGSPFFDSRQDRFHSSRFDRANMDFEVGFDFLALYLWLQNIKGLACETNRSP
jgi:hypothetical protein